VQKVYKMVYKMYLAMFLTMFLFVAFCSAANAANAKCDSIQESDVETICGYHAQAGTNVLLNTHAQYRNCAGSVCDSSDRKACCFRGFYLNTTGQYVPIVKTDGLDFNFDLIVPDDMKTMSWVQSDNLNTLSGADLSDADLSGLSFQSLNMANTKLTNANLGGAILYGTDLTGAILDGAILTSTCAVGCELDSNCGTGNGQFRLAGCYIATTCGSGTILSGNKCVATTTCGPGTILSNNKCVVTATVCGPGTILSSNKCIIDVSNLNELKTRYNELQVCRL